MKNIFNTTLNAFNTLNGTEMRRNQNQPISLISQVRSRQNELDELMKEHQWDINRDVSMIELEHYASITQIDKDWRNYPAQFEGNIADKKSLLTYMICSSEQRHERQTQDGRKEIYYTYSHKPYTIISTKVDSTSNPWISGIFLFQQNKILNFFKIVFLILFMLAVIAGLIYAIYTFSQNGNIQDIFDMYPAFIAIGLFASIIIFLVKKHQKNPQKLVKQRLEYRDFNKRFTVKLAQSASKVRFREFFSPAQQIAMVDQTFLSNVEIVDGYILIYVPKFVFGEDIKAMIQDTKLLVLRYQKELGENQSMNVNYSSEEHSFNNFPDQTFGTEISETKGIGIVESLPQELKADSLEDIMKRFS